MTATVNSVTASASVSAVRLRASVQVIEPRTQVTYVLPVAAVSYILLQTSAVLDNSGRYPYIQDVAVVVEQTVFDLAKVLADVTQPIDQLAADVGKELSDTASISDDCVPLLILLRDYADTQGVTDAQILEFAKGLTEAVSASDVQTASVQKALADAPALVDAIQQIDFAGTLEDTAYMGELITFVKTIARDFAEESVSSIDSFERVLVWERSVADTATASDDDAVDLSKPFSESVSLTDSSIQSIGFERSYSDLIGINGSSGALNVFALNETDVNDGVGVETFQVVFGSVQTDSVTATDSFSADVIVGIPFRLNLKQLNTSVLNGSL